MFKIGSFAQFVSSHGDKGPPFMVHNILKKQIDYRGTMKEVLDTGEWDYYNDAPEWVIAERCKLWEPEEGEWVCCYPDNGMFAVVQFSKEKYWDLTTVEPFIGQLPTFIEV